jgi:hypothetical protein
MFACMLRLVMISMQVELADVPEVDAELEMESPLVSPHLQVETATAECDPHMPVLTEIYLCCACSCHEVEPHAQVECAMAEEAAGVMLSGTGGSYCPHTSLGNRMHGDSITTHKSAPALVALHPLFLRCHPVYSRDAQNSDLTEIYLTWTRVEQRIWRGPGLPRRQSPRRTPPQLSPPGGGCGDAAADSM